MDRFTYFLLGLKSDCYHWKSWILRCFAKSNLTTLEEGRKKFDSRFQNGEFKSNDNHYPYELYSDGDKVCFISPKSGEVVYIKNATVEQPLLHCNESIYVPANVIPNIKEPLTTTTGRLIFNQLCVVYPFGDKIPFEDKVIHYKDIEKIISIKLLDEPEDKSQRKAENIYPEHLDNYYVGTGMVSGLNGICVPSATPYTLTASPKATALAKKLFKEHKHELNDPIVTSKIWAQVKELDMEYVKQDPEYGFLISPKHFDVVRKKMFYCYGEEWSLDGKEMTFIDKPLSEGLDLDNLPAIYNGTREGSFSRGGLTALAGERTKNVVRATAGVTVSIHDCGTTNGLMMRLDPDSAKEYISHSLLISGKTVELTEDNIGSFSGKIVKMRTTAYCGHSENDFCVTCFGKEIIGRENSLSAESGAVTSGFMGTFMSLMHGTVYRTTTYNLDKALGI